MKTIKIDLDYSPDTKPSTLIKTHSQLFGRLAYVDENEKIIKLDRCLKRILGISGPITGKGNMPSKDEAMKYIEKTAQLILEKRMTVGMAFDFSFGPRPDSESYINISTSAEQIAEIRNNTEKQASVRNVARYFLSKDDFLSKIWSPTKPVLHLATALFDIMGDTQGRYLSTSSILDNPVGIILNYNLIRELVPVAEWYRERMIQIIQDHSKSQAEYPDLNWDPTKAIRFVPLKFNKSYCQIIESGKVTRLFTDIFPEQA